MVLVSVYWAYEEKFSRQSVLGHYHCGARRDSAAAESRDY